MDKPEQHVALSIETLEQRNIEQLIQETPLQEQLRLAELIRGVSLALIQSTSLAEMTQRCAELLVRDLDAAFARIWTLNEEAQVLELQASAGLYTHLDGSHSRVPLGTLKIGLIASERLPHLTNAVIGDPRVSEQEWAMREGMVAFAGYPLLVDDRVIGVMALFARHLLSLSVLDAMAAIANTVAIGIDRKRGEQERQHLLIVEQQARGAAESAQQRLASILDHLLDGLIIFDREWRYRYINPQAEPFAGKPQAELLGKNVWEVYPNLNDSLFYKQYHHVMTTHQPVAFRIFSALLDNWFDIRAFPIADGIVVYFRQITEQVQAEEERTRLLQATQQAYEKTEVALSVRNNFLSSVTHDLKTPLSTIKANFQLIQRRARREKQLENSWLNERLDAIERATTKMAGMIDDLLDLSRLQSGRHAEENFLPLDLVPLLRQVVSERKAASNRHKIILKLAEEHLLIRGSATRLDRTLTNLLDNAIKYSPNGGEISIVVTKEEGEQGRSWVCLAIQDQGIGIPQADLPYIFEPFHRASNVIDRIRGTGVGLSSVSQVIEQHQGSISVTSEEGQGSCFIVRLPLLNEDLPPTGISYVMQDVLQ